MSPDQTGSYITPLQGRGADEPEAASGPSAPLDGLSRCLASSCPDGG